MANISVVIPIYNSEKTLHQLIDRLISTLEDLTSNYEIILVDDCSQDNSWRVMKDLRNVNSNIRIIHLLKNYGQHNATIAGFNYVKGDYVIIMDDDLQHPPEEIPKLTGKLEEGYSVVYGQYKIKYHNRIENFFSNLFQKFIHRILEIPNTLFISSFAIFKSDVIKNLIQIKSSYVFLAALVGKTVSPYQIANIEVNHSPRKIGTSNYNIRKYLSLSLNLIINYSVIPLLFLGIFGVFISTISIIYALYILGCYLIDPTYGLMGWNSTMVAITLIGGMVLLSIAIIGEYLRRILTEVSYGQQYVIGEIDV